MVAAVTISALGWADSVVWRRLSARGSTASVCAGPATSPLPVSVNQQPQSSLTGETQYPSPRNVQHRDPSPPTFGASGFVPEIGAGRGKGLLSCPHTYFFCTSGHSFTPLELFKLGEKSALLGDVLKCIHAPRPLGHECFPATSHLSPSPSHSGQGPKCSFSELVALFQAV